MGISADDIFPGGHIFRWGENNCERCGCSKQEVQHLGYKCKGKKKKQRRNRKKEVNIKVEEVEKFENIKCNIMSKRNYKLRKKPSTIGMIEDYNKENYNILGRDYNILGRDSYSLFSFKIFV